MDGPCGRCPVAGVACAGLGHRRYCELMTLDPEAWTPKIRARSGMARSPAPAAFPRPDDPRDRRPRACLVTPSLNIGGADRWMIALMGATAGSVRWTAVAVASWANVVPAIRAESDRFAPSEVGEDAIRAALAASDLAVAWGVDMAWLAGLARECGSPPIVAVSHGVGGWTAGLFRDCSGLAALVGVAGACVRTFPEAERVRVLTIENGVEPGRLVPRSDREAARAAWGLGPGEKALVQVGRISPEKNPESIADAVAELHRRGHREWRGVHVGAGWKEAETRAHAEAVAPGLVRFPGTTDDVASAYLAADALALPSREEACSLTMLEAWWAGTPLIASTVGLTEEPAMASLVRPVAPGCSGADLADAVLADLADPEGTRARAGSASAVARARFSPEIFARRWTETLLATARPRTPPMPETLTPPAPPEPCVCEAPGRCDRHRRVMTGVFRKACLGSTSLPTALRRAIMDHVGKTPDPSWEDRTAEPALPGLVAKAANLAAATARHVAGGQAQATAAELDARLAACVACPLLNREAAACSLCGCPVARKAAWAGESCPDNPPRWGPLA